MHVPRAAFIVLAAVALAACDASYPSRPSSSPVLTALQIHYLAALGPVPVGSGFAFRAYAVNSDGVYEDVTSNAAWASSNPAVVALTGSPSGFSGFVPGLADITATYQGMVSRITVTVVEPDRQYPVLIITPGDPRVIGRTVVATATLWRSRTEGLNVTSSATWTSSDPSVVTAVQGTIQAVVAGTARITATFNGLSTSYGLSVQP